MVTGKAASGFIGPFGCRIAPHSLRIGIALLHERLLPLILRLPGVMRKWHGCLEKPQRALDRLSKRVTRIGSALGGTDEHSLGATEQAKEELRAGVSHTVLDPFLVSV